MTDIHVNERGIQPMCSDHAASLVCVLQRTVLFLILLFETIDAELSMSIEFGGNILYDLGVP